MNSMYPTNWTSPLNTFNPYAAAATVIPNYQPVQQPGPHMEIQRVNGKESAMAYSIGPNSSVILVDNLEPKIWLVTTDASGYKAIKGFTITPDEEQTEQAPIQVTVKDQLDAMMERMNKLEERMNSYGKPDYKSSHPGKSGNGNASANDRNGQGREGSFSSSTANGGN